MDLRVEHTIEEYTPLILQGILEHEVQDGILLRIHLYTVHHDGIMIISSPEHFGQRAHRQMRISSVHFLAPEQETQLHTHRIGTDETRLNVMENE